MFVCNIKPLGKGVRVKRIPNISEFKIQDEYLILYVEDEEHGLLTHRLKMCYYQWIEIYYMDKLVVRLDG